MERHEQRYVSNDGALLVPFEINPDLAVDTVRTLPGGGQNPNYGNLYATWDESGEGALGRLLNDPTLYGEMVAVTNDLRRLAAQIEAGEGTVGQLLEDEGLYRRMVDVVQRAATVLAQIDSGKGTAGRMLSDDDLYERLTKFVTDTQSLINDIRENPAKYFTLEVF